MTRYNVHIYREMRLTYIDIEADTPEAAAALASDKPTDAADNIDDCEGENLGAVVDLVGDEDYSRSVTIDFEAERLRKAAPAMLASLRAVLPYAENENQSLYECWKRDGDEAVKQVLDACENAIDQAHTAIVEATDGDPPWRIDFDVQRDRRCASHLLGALAYVRAILHLRHLNEASDDEVDEALKIGEAAIAAAKTAGILSTPPSLGVEVEEE